MAHSSKKTALLLAGAAAIALGLSMSPASAAPLTRTEAATAQPLSSSQRKSSSAAGRRSIPMCTPRRAAPAAGAPISASCPTPRATSRSKRCSGSIRRPTSRRACAPGPRNRGSDLPLPTPMFRLYARVLGLLGPQMRLGWLLALANVALATAALAEPVLFGRIIDALAGAQGTRRRARLAETDAARRRLGRLRAVPHRLRRARRRSTPTSSPIGAARPCCRIISSTCSSFRLSFHSATHSGRLMKVMLTGTDTLWWLWLGFFREHLAAIVSIAVLLPLALYLNWRLGLLLIGLVAHLPRAHRVRAAQDRSHAEIGRALLLRPRRARLGHARQCRAGAELHPRRGRGARIARGGRAPARRADAGALLVGAGLDPHQGLDHAHHAGDPGPRALPLRARADDDRRHRHVHELRRHADPAARAGGAVRQFGVHERAAARGILRRARHHDLGEGPQERGDAEEGARRGRVRRRHLLL